MLVSSVSLTPDWSRRVDLSKELLEHSIRLLRGYKTNRTPEADLRRAVSSAYYALFHQINGDAATLLAPHVSLETNHRIQRWFDHLEMKKICGRFTASELSQPLLGLIGPSASPDLQKVARAFVVLQEARHGADYDLSYRLSYSDAAGHIRFASEGALAWERLQGSAEANIFILSLLMWKNWERERI
jgi:hypothetical protein